MAANLLQRKATSFVLWRLLNTSNPPQLIIGQFQAGNPPTLVGARQLTMTRAAGFTDLWELPASGCGLQDGQIYHYWFAIDDSDPGHNPPARVQIADPAATTIDWRLRGPVLPPPYTDDDRHPASVIRYEEEELVPCDPGGEIGSFVGDPASATLPTNNRLVIYELPTAWSRISVTVTKGIETDVGTFRDVTAMIDRNAGGANFSDLKILQPGRSYLTELGINALELLPPADSFFKREWGYDTANFLAPDFELGFPEGDSWPTANADLAALVLACHQNGIRFFVDMVMAFARQYPTQALDFPEFHIADPGSNQNDPDALTSTRGYGVKEVRNGFGSVLFRYARFVDKAYDPITGKILSLVPARQMMKAQLSRWMLDFRIDGIRMDSIENVASWDFIGEFKDLARQTWHDRWTGQGLTDGPDADARFLVVGEELSLPMDILTQGRLDGLWNERFKSLVRSAVLGQNDASEPSFEWTVRKAIDCRILNFTDGAQAVLYLTSHDVEGYRNERMFNFLNNNGVTDTEPRIKLAFVCLLTAVGVPMILAGEEFADQHDLFDQFGHVTQAGGKQVDPVNYSRLGDDWRRRIFAYVSRLTALRTTHDALASNDTNFIHVDLNDGKRVLAWLRGQAGNPVVVVANFSDFVTANPTDPSSVYVVNNWPATPSGRQWREVTQDRIVPPGWAGREPIFAWEAKVYALA